MKFPRVRERPLLVEDTGKVTVPEAESAEVPKPSLEAEMPLKCFASTGPVDEVALVNLVFGILVDESQLRAFHSYEDAVQETSSDTEPPSQGGGGVGNTSHDEEVFGGVRRVVEELAGAEQADAVSSLRKELQITPQSPSGRIHSFFFGKGREESVHTHAEVCDRRVDDETLDAQGEAKVSLVEGAHLLSVDEILIGPLTGAEEGVPRPLTELLSRGAARPG
jgi:hypothetical protein